jgi:hypothetical protein
MGDAYPPEKHFNEDRFDRYVRKACSKRK